MSTPTPHAKEVFLDALELSEQERAGFLFERCGSNQELRHSVERLLAAHAVADSRIGGEPVPLLQRLARVTDAPDELNLGDRIGPYRLIRELGQGGFGTVFLAEQEEPVRRSVALKVIKLGMDTRAVIARFEAERQALALMESANIARVYEAGATDRGRPYFAMEYVDGAPITEFCRTEGLALEGRLLLILSVCRAIQHAHQKGIIHRDIKPTNVLVTKVDGEAQPKVIDFGIAKATDRRLTPGSFATRDGHLLGTPLYMSPEQVEGIDVDTRSDVYALGVLLFELLCGESPFEVESQGVEALQRAILEDTPRKPSATVSRSAQGAGSKGVEFVPDELDWIVLRCMEKERDRRYPTAAALARDLSSFLEERPIEAAPPSIWYRTRKLVRRHRAASIATVAVLFSLILGILGTSIGLLSARALNEQLDRALQLAENEAERAGLAEKRAEAESREALLQAQRAGAINEFLNKDLLGAAAPSSSFGRGRDVLMREVLDAAAGRIDQESQAGGRFAQLPSVEKSLRATLGETYFRLGFFKEAHSHLNRALAIMDASGVAYTRERADLELMLAEVLRRQGNNQEAQALAVKVHEESVKAWGADDRDSLSSLVVQGVAMADRGQLLEGIALLEDVRERSTLALGELDDCSLECNENLAIYYTMAGRKEDAEAIFKLCFANYARKYGAEHSETLVAASNYANFLRTEERFDEAEPVYISTLEQLRKTLGPEHPHTLTIAQGLGRVWTLLGKMDAAEELLRETETLLIEQLGPDSEEALETASAIGHLLQWTGRTKEAEEVYRQAWARSRKKFGPDHLETMVRAKELSAALYSLGQLDEVETILRDVLAGELKLFGEQHPSSIRTRVNLGLLQHSLGNLDQAELELRAALEQALQLSGPGDHLTLSIQSDLAAILTETGELFEAETLAREAVERGRDLYVADSLPLATNLLRWGVVLGSLGEVETARNALREAQSILTENFPDHFRTQEVAEKLSLLDSEAGAGNF